MSQEYIQPSFKYNYQNQTYKSGTIFDYWSCGSAERGPDGKRWPGAFPKGFLKRLKTAFAEVWPNTPGEIAHVCSGRLPSSEGIRIDIYDDHNPDILSNAENFAEAFLNAFHKIKWSIADPPYTNRRAQEYYNQVLLNKSKMLREMEKITEVGGFIGILDQYSLNGYPRTLKKIALIAVSSIPNPDLRVFTVWRKLS